MKRWCLMLLTGLMVVCAFTGLKAEQEPVTINMWDWFVTQSNFLDSEIKLFEEKNPGIKVKRTRQATARYAELINLAQRSGNLPDVLAIPVLQRTEWLQNGYFTPLDKWVNKEFVNRFPKGAFMPGINMYNGRYYSYPMQGVEHWCQLYINNTVFRKAGLVDKKTGKILYPQTWGELKNYAKIITQKGKGQYYGFGFAFRPEHLTPNFFYEWARTAGARGGNQELAMGVDYKVGRYNFTGPDVLGAYTKMFKFVLSLIKEKIIYPSSMSIEDETLKAAFADGKIGMIMGGAWNMTGWQTTHPNFSDYECVMIPPPDKNGYVALCPVNIATAWYGMSSNVKHPEEAWKLMEWFAHPEVGARYVKGGLGVNIFPSANVISNARTRQYGQYLELSAKYAKPGPNPFGRNPQLALVDVKQVTPNHINVFWGIISGQIKEKDITQALKGLEDRMNKALDEGFDAAIKKGYKVSKDDLKFSDWNPLEPYEQK